MPSLSDIRFHIKSVEQTRKITNAMHLISSSRMRKTMKSIEQNRAYFYKAVSTMRKIRRHADFEHPYIVHRKGEDHKRTAYIVIAGDKGLSGSYNRDVLLLVDKSMAEHKPTHIFTVGDVAASHFHRLGIEVHENFLHIGQAPSVNTARRLANIVMELYDDDEIDELRVVYTHFVNTMVHIPEDVQILPIELDEIGKEAIADTEITDDDDFLYDPSPEEVFSELVPQFIIGYTYGALVHSYASENLARMTAMESATNSADEMLEKLTKQFHTARQVSITNELAEIVGAANVLEKNDNSEVRGI